MLTDYLKPEFVGTKEATEINMLFQNLNKNWRMVLRVPVAEGERVTRFLKRAVKSEYTFHRRTGGGKRSGCMDLTCLRKDATYFKYYFNNKQPAYPVRLIKPTVCPTCGK
jgi:hypothetical protein